jgi:hypothetical protein
MKSILLFALPFTVLHPSSSSFPTSRHR